MNKRKLILPFVILCTLFFTGCQLAKPTNSDIYSSDRLCGVLITIGNNNSLERQELSDEDITVNRKGKVELQDSALATAGEARVEGKAAKDGHTVVFDGIPGYYMGLLTEKGTTGEDCNVLMCDSSLNNLNVGVNITDEVKEQTCEATLYVNTGFSEAFYLNPVYLTSDGTYYTLLGHATGTSFSDSPSGSICSQTIKSNVTQTTDTSSKSEQSIYKVNVKSVDVVKKVVIKEMNHGDELIRSSEYLPDSPENYIVLKDTAYVIVEETLVNNQNAEYIKRSAYTPLPKSSDETGNQHLCNFSGENNVIHPKSINFMLN